MSPKNNTSVRRKTTTVSGAAVNAGWDPASTGLNRVDLRRVPKRSEPSKLNALHRVECVKKVSLLLI